MWGVAELIATKMTMSSFIAWFWIMNSNFKIVKVHRCVKKWGPENQRAALQHLRDSFKVNLFCSAPPEKDNGIFLSKKF